MKIAIFYKINANYYTLANGEKNREKNSIDKSITIVSHQELLKMDSIFINKGMSFYKSFPIESNIAIVSYSPLEYIFNIFTKFYVRLKTTSTISNFRLQRKDNLIKGLLKPKNTLEKTLEVYKEYTFQEKYSLWIFNQETEYFTFVCGSDSPTRSYIKKSDDVSLSEALHDNYKNERRSVKDSDIAPHKKNGLKSLTRAALRLGTHDQIGVLSFYSENENFYLSEDIIDEIKSIVKMKYNEQIRASARGLERVTKSLFTQVTVSIENYLDVLTKSICTELQYEAASAFILIPETNSLRLASTYDAEGQRKVPEVIYPPDAEALTNEVKSNPNHIVIVYDLQSSRFNSHIYDEITEHPGSNWIGIPISNNNRVIAVIRAKNKYIYNSEGVKIITPPAPPDHFNLTTITSIVESQLSNLYTYRELKSKLELHDNFSKVYRHEIRGPVSSIAATPNSIKRDLEKLKIDKDTKQRIERKLEDLQSLIENLSFISKTYNIEGILESSKIQNQKLSLLGDVIIPIEKLTKSYYEQKYDSNLIVNHDSMRGAYIFGSKELYSMAIYALIDNAGKYQRLEKGEIKVYARHDHKSDYVMIYIENDGIEIAEEEIGKIFSCDYRGKKAEELRIDGSGIGLWLCAEILKKSQGEIHLDSRTSPVRFRIKLPRGQQ